MQEKRPYTEAQEQIAKDILALNDYYEILAVKKDANENDLKKAYRKRAIKLHPDKNPAPSANEAFQKVEQARTTLEDPNKRR